MAAQSLSSAANTPRVDSHLLKFSQAWTVALTALAFALQLRWLVVVAALCLLISAAAPAVGPFRLLYRFVALPTRLLRPRIVEDDPAPHRFAQAVGTAFLIASSLVLWLAPGAAVVGWTLDLIVFALSLVNLTVGFCLGCFVYYQLGRVGIAPHVRYAGGFRWRGA
ncbi:MAG TPA: DUF4395 domain-containing protein [Ktedonobacterales bacterium]|nr:DUF4395 domain-containing protein [Ktedonobacterales bacterium]